MSLSKYGVCLMRQDHFTAFDESNQQLLGVVCSRPIIRAPVTSVKLGSGERVTENE